MRELSRSMPRPRARCRACWPCSPVRRRRPTVLADCRGEVRPPLPKGSDETALPPMGSPEVAMSQPVIARDTVRYVGEIVVLIVAETKDSARDAAERIEIDYAPLPAVVATSDSAQPGAAAVWPQCPDNVCFSFKKGDRAAVDTAFARAAH